MSGVGPDFEDICSGAMLCKNTRIGLHRMSESGMGPDSEKIAPKLQLKGEVSMDKCVCNGCGKTISKL